MKRILIIAALALGFSVTAAHAQRALNITELTDIQLTDPLAGNLVEVHKKHKKYKRYSKKHYKKHHRIERYARKHHRHHRHNKHRHHRYQPYYYHGHALPLLFGHGGIVIRIY